jgi:uncharacterized DUF497 family protein
MAHPRIDITWDSTKAQANESKHGVTFSEAAEVLLDPMALTLFDAANSTLEERWFTLGETTRRRLLAVSHTYVSQSEETSLVRIISAREATRRERQQYQNEPR